MDEITWTSAKAKLQNTTIVVYVASANDQAELMNQMPQYNGMWFRRDALGAIDLSRKSTQLRKKKGDAW